MARKTELEKHYTTAEKVKGYETSRGVFDQVFTELKELGRKKPELTLSAAKCKLINRILQDIKVVMTDEPEAKYLDLLDEEMLPQYSDSILILAQFEAALDAFVGRHYGWDGNEHKWYLPKDKKN